MTYACSDDKKSPTECEGHDDQLDETWSLIKITIPGFSLELTPEQAEFMVSGVLKSDGTFSMTTIYITGCIVESGE